MAACVQTFVGFSGPVAAPDTSHLSVDQRAGFEIAALAMIEAFVHGLDDERDLQKIGIEAAAIGMTDLKKFFSLGTALDQLYLRLSVVTKPGSISGQESRQEPA